MGKEDLTMIPDSGSNHVVLFRLPDAMAKISSVPTTMRTIEGAVRGSHALDGGALAY